MRTGIIIADGKPVSGPVEAGKARAEYKRLLEDPKSKFDELELWDSGSGRIKFDSRRKREEHAKRMEQHAKEAAEQAEKSAPKKLAEAKK